MLKINLTGKTSVITGATGELGRTMAKTLAMCGSDVVIGYNNNFSKAEELKNEIKKQYNVEVFAQKVNVKKLEDVMAFAEYVKNAAGDPEIIVNCAASSTNWQKVLDEDIASYYDHFETTVIHNVAMVKAFVPAMIEKGYGRVIGINTECAMQCFETQSAYASGKRGMDGIYRVLSKEIGKYGITVNQIAPGWTVSDRERANGSEDKDEYYTSRVPMKRRGDDQDIANAVAFLASDLAGFINGIYLPVCGGNVLPGI